MPGSSAFSMSFLISSFCALVVSGAHSSSDSVLASKAEVLGELSSFLAVASLAGVSFLGSSLVVSSTLARRVRLFGGGRLLVLLAGLVLLGGLLLFLLVLGGLLVLLRLLRLFLLAAQHEEEHDRDDRDQAAADAQVEPGLVALRRLVGGRTAASTARPRSAAPCRRSATCASTPARACRFFFAVGLTPASGAAGADLAAPRTGAATAAATRP
jgi:hypothetical protein